MCIYSTHVPEVDRRNAKVGESLTRGAYGGHACLLGDDGKVTCLKPGTTMVIDNASFKAALDRNRQLKEMVGQSITVRLLTSAAGFSADWFHLPNGTVAGLEWLAMGTTFRIPRKVRKDKGIAKPRNLARVLGLDQIKADIPVKQPVTVKD